MRKNDMVLGNLGHCNHDLLAKQRWLRADNADDIILGYNDLGSKIRLKIWLVSLETVFNN